jgi:hypothetical protein
LRRPRFHHFDRASSRVECSRRWRGGGDPGIDPGGPRFSLTALRVRFADAARLHTGLYHSPGVRSGVRAATAFLEARDSRLAHCSDDDRAYRDFGWPALD